MQKNSGHLANKSGKGLEHLVEESIRDHGFECVFPAPYIFPMEILSQRLFAKQIQLGEDIYGKQRKFDFLLFSPKHNSYVAIECKWQAVKGTVEEKLPFQVLSINNQGFDTIVVLDGNGYSKGAKEWIVKQAGKDRVLGVLSAGEFQKWLKKWG